MQSTNNMYYTSYAYYTLLPLLGQRQMVFEFYVVYMPGVEKLPALPAHNCGCSTRTLCVCELVCTYATSTVCPVRVFILTIQLF